MNRLEFLGSLFIWSIVFYVSAFLLICGVAHDQILLWTLPIIPVVYSFYRLLLSGYKRVQDIFPGKDVGLLLLGFIVIISIVPFGTLLLLLLPGNLLGKKNEDRP